LRRQVEDQSDQGLVEPLVGELRDLVLVDLLLECESPVPQELQEDSFNITVRWPTSGKYHKNVSEQDGSQKA
jgi:hypothetical protein